jgi:hypothetical protein
MRLTSAEAAGAGATTVLAVVVVLAYLADRVGLGLHPRITVASGALIGVLAWRCLATDARPSRGDALTWAGVVSGVFAFLLWISGFPPQPRRSCSPLISCSSDPRCRRA